MELSAELKSKNAGQLEEWFVNSLSATPLPVDYLMAAISSLVSEGKHDVADNWAELLQDTLAERDDKIVSLSLLRLRAGWKNDDPAFRDACQKALFKVFKGKIGQGVVNTAGFADANIAPAECLRRLTVIIGLKPGVLCHDKTWGFGVISKVDDFYKKVTVDFEKKPAHQMSFAYVGEVLELLSDDHLFAVKHRDPQGIARLLREDPAEVVRMAIRSFGPLSTIRIREIFTGSIVPEAEWKTFWEAARKKLKSDPLIKIPSSREEPIRMLDRAEDHHAELLESLTQERDPQTILNLVSQIETWHGKAGLPADLRRLVTDKLAFALKGARGRQHGLAAVTLLTAKRTGVLADLVEAPGVIDGLFAPETFLAATTTMPAREVADFIALLTEKNADKVLELLFALLPRMQLNVLNDAMDFLLAAGKQKECADYFRSSVHSEQASLEMLYWLCKHTDEVISWSVASLAELLIRSINALEQDRAGKGLQSQKQLRALFGQRPWMEKMLAGMDGRERESLLSKVSVSTGWEPVEQRAVMATIIKLYPELGKVLASDTAEDNAPTIRSRFTSWRSYHQRQQQLRKLVEEDVPNNSRDIGIARSYGDLRENAEYKAAKEHQNILMRRQKEWETGLREVKGSDFSGMAVNVAGVGTSVVVKDPAGHTERYNVLGEWDGDEALGIISSMSEIARAMEGHKVGDEIVLPAALGGTKAVIVEISGVSDAIKKWATG